MPDEVKSKLIDLIDYVGQVIKLSEKPAFNIKDYRQPIFHEIDLKNRIGIEHDTSDENGPIWLQVKRLKRIDPPSPTELIEKWITVGRDPFAFPKIESIKTDTIPEDETKSQIEDGILIAEDLQPSLKYDHQETHCDVIYRLDNLPDIKDTIENYIKGPWHEWSGIEKPRWETIKIYETLFNLQQSIQIQGQEKPLELVWGMGVARWRKEGEVVDHAIVEQLVEIEINKDGGTIIIRPRGTAPQVFLKPFFALNIAGVQTAFQFSSKFFDDFTEDQELSPFVPDTFTPVLRHAASILDKSGIYYPDEIDDITGRRLPPVREYLTVTDTWVIYARRRSDNFFINDLNRLKEAVEKEDELPGPAKRLVTRPSNENTYTGGRIDLGAASLTNYSGLSDGIKGSEPEINATYPDEFFFPKPYNDEQVTIAKRLAETDGVVVQGPPGTGKTHTIANIICHYLATGKRVLVASKGEAALSVLRDHIPEGIRELTISLLTSEREGLKQLEKAVGVLSNTATHKNRGELENEIIITQRRIVDLKQQVSQIDAELFEWAQKHLKPINRKGSQDSILPLKLAKKVVADKEHHVWFTDRPQAGQKFIPQFKDEDIRNIRQARKILGRDLIYVNCMLPKTADLPDKNTLAAVHQDLVNAQQLEASAVENNIPILRASATDSFERAEKLLDSINQLVIFFKGIENAEWIRKLFFLWQKKGLDSERTKLFTALMPLMTSITEQRLQVVGYTVSIPDEALQCKIVCEAVEKASKGKRPFGMIKIGKSKEKAVFHEMTIEGHPPASPEEWEKVREYLCWRKEVSAFCIRWTNVSQEFDLPTVEDRGNQTGLWIADVIRLINKAMHMASQISSIIRKEIPGLFPHGMDAQKIITSVKDARESAKAIELNLSKIRLFKSRKAIEEVSRYLAAYSGDIVDAMKVFFKDHAGNSKYTNSDISDKWIELNTELNRLLNLREQMETVKKVSALVHNSSAKNWAKALLNESDESTVDQWTPTNWRESWNWVINDNYLRQIDGRNKIRKLSEKRITYEKDLTRAFEKVVQLRTYLGLKNNMTPRVESALVMFTAAIQRIGRGTGIRAQRFRKDARNAMEDSYSAIPCWIMPSWRISESLPAKLGAFDLVIVDEASQSDITALPALLRGKKMLIVGDDKQVSPTAAFIEEKKLLQLKHNYLSEQPFEPLLLPGASLYDLANALFPGQRIMLREHFRCVEPIIKFSMRFYSDSIIPLRIPRPSERIDPPLVDVYIPYGAKDKRQINIAEAEAITDEICRIAIDPKFKSRSIGVVCLLGSKQALYIQNQLLGRLGEETFLRHQIACGDPPTFQGKERDIMFVSMVECQNTKSAKTALLFQQRYNVALSRAKDRMYLFRSVSEEMLRHDDLKIKVIQHFQSPMGNLTDEVRSLIDLCESDFERNVFTRLINLGYKVTPQVKVGPYSIDMVVDGIEDRRLAIELDGDQYHTPDRWADDFRRQQILERVGWKFWRCWGSSFYLEPDECLDDLVQTLKSMGIEPLSTDDATSNHYTEHRVIEFEQADDHDFDEGQENEDISEKSPEQMVLFSRQKMASANTQASEGPDEDIVSPSKKTIPDEDSFDEEIFVEIGDRVLISYNDDPTLQSTIRISEKEHDPAMKIIKYSKPLAQALLEAEINEEIKIQAGGKARIVTILDIEKQRIPKTVN
ncbi:MAG: AAA family ATPase [Desulfobacteraceae bacterium]|nr:AAA family ATPase [Desulfobacteraceae bacterium]MBC2755184.1 AAA family ATPase [Desulfobacteraceae bacterium]